MTRRESLTKARMQEAFHDGSRRPVTVTASLIPTGLAPGPPNFGH